MDIRTFTPETLAYAQEVLRNGGIVAHATETCYGFACDLQNQGAAERLFALKNRSTDQVVSALCASIDMAKTYVEWNLQAEQLATEYLPGPLTIILPIRPNCTLYCTPTGAQTVGIRLSSHPTAQALVEGYGSPLSTTSANLHGEPSAYSVDDLKAQYDQNELQPDLILDDGTLPSAASSTVIDLSTDPPRVLRHGDIQPDFLAQS